MSLALSIVQGTVAMHNHPHIHASYTHKVARAHHPDAGAIATTSIRLIHSTLKISEPSHVLLVKA